jgi:4-amino-4-deoxy-L-arabinose transferase-like glycosyltransferase
MLSALRNRRTDALYLGAHVAVLLAISYVALANISVADYSPDEFVYANCGTQLATTSTFCNAGHPPLAKMWFGLFEWLFGSSIHVARFANGVVAILTAVLVYLLIRHLANWKWALVGAALWGLSPQVGTNGSAADLVIRISRYAFLEPMLCLFIVLALYGGVRWAEGGSRWWVALCTVGAVGSMMSKEIGFVITPILLGVGAATCWWSDRRRILSDLGVVVSSGLAVVVLIFSAFGPRGGYHDFIAFAHALTHNDGLVGQSIFNGHLYTPPPWWLSLRYGEMGVGAPLALAIMVGVVLALSLPRTRLIASYCVATSVVTVMALILSAREINFYWLAWEPPLVIAAVAGWAAAFSEGFRRWLVVGSLALASFACAATVVDVATVKPGPYQQLGQRVNCVAPCVALSVGKLFIPSLYGVNTIQGVAGQRGILVQGLEPNVVLAKGALTGAQRLPDVVIFDTNSVDYYLIKGDIQAIRLRLRVDGFRRVFQQGPLIAYRR